MGMLMLALALLAAVFGAVETTSAQTSDDGFIKGYAAAVLERDFRLNVPSLRVENGIVMLQASDLRDVNRNAVVEARSRIRGVVRVSVQDATAAPPAPPEATPPAPAKTVDLGTGIFPGGEHLFRPLIADPRWPHFAVEYQYYIADKKLGSVAAVTFGESLNFYRSRLGPLWWGVGLQAGVFGIFDLEAESKDLINADYFVAAALDFRHDALSGLMRVFHQS